MKMTAISGRVRTATRCAHVVNLMNDPVDTDALRAVAHEADQDQFYRWAKVISAAADEVDRLRALIAHQQHDDLCAVWELNGGTSEDGCTCWKAEAL